MSRKLLTVDEFRASAKNGARPEGTVLRLAVAEPEVAADASRKRRAAVIDKLAATIILQGALDRMRVK